VIQIEKFARDPAVHEGEFLDHHTSGFRFNCLELALAARHAQGRGRPSAQTAWGNQESRLRGVL
jgi:hypothetical protein